MTDYKINDADIAGFETTFATMIAALKAKPITVAPPSGIAPKALFTATPLSGVMDKDAPLTVQFQNVSTGTLPLTYKWDMSDGTGNLPENAQKSPSWRFYDRKSYTIKLTVTNAFGTDTLVRENYITVTDKVPSVVVVPPVEPPVEPPVVVPPTTGTYGARAVVDGYKVGGEGYPTIPRASSTSVITTLANLKTKIEAAKPGNIIFVPDTATITFPAGFYITIPKGVTLASSRGLNGSKGALLIKKESSGGWTDCMFKIGGDDVKITGFRFEGQMFPDTATPVVSEADYLICISNSTGYSGKGFKGLDVYNNEAYGWAYAWVMTQRVPMEGRPLVHHNYIHHCQARGEGYGVEVFGGNCKIYANLFDYNRHNVTGTGIEGEGYEVCDNIDLGHGHPIGGCRYDVHENGNYSNDKVACAGDKYLIHHNTSMKVTGEPVMNDVHIRDIPTTGAYVYNNDFQTDWGSGSTEMGVQKTVWQSCLYSSRFGNVFCTDNKWKGVVYSGNEGILWLSTHA